MRSRLFGNKSACRLQGTQIARFRDPRDQTVLWQSVFWRFGQGKSGRVALSRLQRHSLQRHRHEIVSQTASGVFSGAYFCLNAPADLGDMHLVGHFVAGLESDFHGVVGGFFTVSVPGFSESEARAPLRCHSSPLRIKQGV